MDKKLNSLNISTLEAKLFLKLYETENTVDAATDLGWSKAQVTHNISKLESKLGKTLFSRNRRIGKFIATKNAHLIRSYMQQLVMVSNLAYESVNQETTSVMIRASQSILKYYMGPYIKNFLENNKDFRLSFIEQDDLSKDNQALNEICLTHLVEKSSRYEYIPYHSFKQRLWASRQYIDGYGAPETIEDLYNHRLILRRNVDNPKILFGSKYTKLYLSTAKNPNLCDVRGVNVADYLCESGCGIMAGSVEGISLSKLQVEEVFPKFEGDEIDVYLAIDKSFLESNVAKKVVNWVFECRNKIFKKIGVLPTYEFTPYKISLQI